ncbi:MAG: endonuclease/exonuclease/phosphatase family protein [Cyanobacteria bacterium J06629_2]
MTSTNNQRLMFWNKRLFYYLFATWSLMAIALFLAGYLGRLNLYLEFASGYKLQILQIALCSLIYFSLTRRKLWIAISLVGVLLNLAVILPWYFNRSAIVDAAEYAPLKVFSYNVLWKNDSEGDYQRAIALVEQEQPDIAIFQESVPHWHRQLVALKASYPYHVRAAKLEIEVYSKIPLLNPQVELYGTYRGLVIVDLQLGDRQTKFIATHAYPQLFFGHAGWEIRNEQLQVGIGEYIASLDQPAIVLGDLNVSLWSPFYHSMIQTSGLRNARQGFGVLPTHSVVAPQWAALSAPIDHCLVTSEIQVQDFKLGKAIGSDHRPIIAELLVPQK